MAAPVVVNSVPDLKSVHVFEIRVSVDPYTGNESYALGSMLRIVSPLNESSAR